MTIKKEDLEIDESLTLQNAAERGLSHELDVMIDPLHPEWGLEELMQLKTDGHHLGKPDPEKSGHYVGVYEPNSPGDDDQPVDLLDNEADSSLD
jgi:hypothetical protein